ncbi:peptidoglycan-binding domain-containing protein [Actinoplanes sp. NPDC051851]|uniref:peptidoglycan-binding domain-containing protein n=1 Tax=Actinoplanes sp. NPDC051851 TaxID=3154753 RepID=UPI003438DF28
MTVGAALTAAFSGFALPPATSASAATPSCTTRVELAVYSGSAYVPMNSSKNNTSCSMYEGASNNGVLALQEMINDCYVAKDYISHAKLTEDGDFGSNTYAALRQVQNYISVGVDGDYGPETAAAIKSKSSNGTCYKFSQSPG